MPFGPAVVNVIGASSRTLPFGSWIMAVSIFLCKYKDCRKQCRISSYSSNVDGLPQKGPKGLISGNILTWFGVGGLFFYLVETNLPVDSTWWMASFQTAECFESWRYNLCLFAAPWGSLIERIHSEACEWGAGRQAAAGHSSPPRQSGSPSSKRWKRLNFGYINSFQLTIYI